MPKGAKMRPECIAYTVKDAAIVLGTSERQIRRAMDIGQLPAHVLLGEGYPRILHSDLVDWFHSQPKYKPKAVV